MSDALRFRHRESGEIRLEEVFTERELRFFYQSAVGRALAWAWFTRSFFNRWYGRQQRAPKTRAAVAGFVARLGIDASEAELPIDAYATLDDFFTRRLKPGARPVDPNPAHFLSPVDARLRVYPRLEGGRLRVKGHQITVDELLGGAEDAARFHGGAAFVLRLAAADYHRFHFPDAGTASASRAIPGRLHSVHPIALARGAPSFRNKRAVTRLSSAGFGEIALVEVGAMAVGTIVQTFSPGRVERGQEKGYFRFGGSAVIVLTEPGRVELDPDLVADSAADLETWVKFGGRLGRAP